jgi:hypothetical protein
MMNGVREEKQKYLVLAETVERIFRKWEQEQNVELLERLTTSQSMRESIFQPNPSFILENSKNNELFQTKDFMGTGQMQNFSMIYKNEGMSVNYDLNESSMFIDNLNNMHFYGEPDEPVRSKKLTKVSADVNRSTYVTLEAQMSNKYKER